MEDVLLVCFLIEALVFLTEWLCPKAFLDQKVLEDDCEVIEIVESPIPPDDDEKVAQEKQECKKN